jgi:branched-chain amino acid transport system substrate-binding protein
MPKVARYVANNLKAKTVALIYVNNDFGKGGKDSLIKALEPLGVKVTTDISTDQNQVDFSAAVLKAKQANTDVVFAYTNEEESARLLRELRKQGVTKPIVGETVLTSQKVIELAGESANGAVAHVGLTVDAPIPAMRAFRAKFEKDWKFTPDHNGIKGYTGVYVLKAAIEKAGKLDRQLVAKTMHGLKLKAADHPGILMDVSFDDKGDLDRESFIVEARDGKQVVKEILPPLGAK